MVVAGDFNAKTSESGMPISDSRVLEVAARLDPIVINTGSTSNFRRPGCSETKPDKSLASECLATIMTDL